MMATMLMAIMPCIGLLEALASNGRKKNERTRPKDKQEDCLSRREHLNIETWLWNVVAVVMYKNTIVERMLRALELKANVWSWTEIRPSRKKIRKSRRNTIGLLGNTHDQLLVYSKAHYCRGINKTRTLESIGSESKEEEEHDWERR